MASTLTSCFILLRLLCRAAKELGLLLSGLETSVAKLGGSVDELQCNLFGGLAADLWQQRLAQSDDALLRTHDSALEHYPIFIHLAEVCKATQRGDALLGKICLCCCTIRVLL